MRPVQKTNFLEWYEVDKISKNGKYDFNEEIAAYRKMDVEVFRRCCEIFRQLFMELSDEICRLVCSTTIAGFCSYFWRSRILQPDIIGLLPVVSTNRSQSRVAMMWMDWEVEEGQTSST